MKRVVFALLGLSAAAIALAQALPADHVYKNEAVGDTTFSHAKHMEKLDGCPRCHLHIFPMEAPEGAGGITMADMNAGKNCGTCHQEGGGAFAASECTKCHVKAAAAGAPPDVVYPNDMLGATTFSHAAHMARGATCAECHPDPFAMAKGLVISMADMNAGENCGRCHKADGPGFPSQGDCTKCHVK